MALSRGVHGCDPAGTAPLPHAVRLALSALAGPCRRCARLAPAAPADAPLFCAHRVRADCGPRVRRPSAQAACAGAGSACGVGWMRPAVVSSARGRRLAAWARARSRSTWPSTGPAQAPPRAPAAPLAAPPRLPRARRLPAALLATSRALLHRGPRPRPLCQAQQAASAGSRAGQVGRLQRRPPAAHTGASVAARQAPHGWTPRRGGQRSRRLGGRPARRPARLARRGPAHRQRVDRRAAAGTRTGGLGRMHPLRLMVPETAPAVQPRRWRRCHLSAWLAGCCGGLPGDAMRAHPPDRLLTSQRVLG
jgi:hypothetical protein